MKYSSSITINCDKDALVALWQDGSKYHLWQDGFISINPMPKSDDGNQRNRLFYKMGKREMELVETVLDDSMPDYKICLYEHSHMSNTLKSIFNTDAEGNTILTYEVDYLQFNHFMPRLMAKFFPSVFRKQSEKWMKQFKLLAEQ